MPVENVFWPGIAAMAAMYAAVFVVGLWAGAQETKREKAGHAVDEMMLAGRSIPLWISLLTMTATWVGGGYINGTAEAAYASGVLFGVQGGIGYALSLLIGGLLFARVMRNHGFSTLVDPLEDRYGPWTAALLMLSAVLAEILWTAAVLLALGLTFGTVVGIPPGPSIVLSAAVAIAYTMFGGLRAVAYTDVVQLALLAVGLAVAAPYVISAAGGLSAVVENARPDAGFADPRSAISYADWTILFVLGGIPWNSYFQRVLASRHAEDAVRMSVWAALFCALAAVPPLFMGLAARGIDWGALGATPIGVGLGGSEAIVANLAEKPALVLPYLLRLAVPTWVAVVGLGAVSAAVMASIDSAILSASSLVAWNGYRRLVNPAATERQVVVLVRVLVVVIGAAATVIALRVGSVSALWLLCGDVVYCVLFPQLTLALFDKKANRIGALAGFAVSVFLRVGGGDGSLGIGAVLPYPDWGDAGDFPFRTVAMLGGVITSVLVSRATAALDAPRALVPRAAGG